MSGLVSLIAPGSLDPSGFISAGGVVDATVPGVPGSNTDRSFEATVVSHALWGVSIGEVWAHVYVYFEASYPGTQIVGITDPFGAEVAAIEVLPPGNVRLRIAGTVESESVVKLVSGAWNSVFLHYKVHPTVGVFDVYVDDDLDAPIASFGGDTSFGGAPAHASGWFFGGVFGASKLRFANMTVFDPSLPTYTAPPTSQTVSVLLPVADGVYTGFTPSSGASMYQMVDGASADLGTYCEAAAVGDSMSVSAEPIAVTGQILASPVLTCHIRRVGTVAGTGVAAIAKLISGTTVQGPTVLVPDTGAPVALTLRLPAIPGGWTQDEVNGAEFGIRTVA